MKIRIVILIAAAACLCGCARVASTGTNDASKRYFDAWVYVQKEKHPEYLWKLTELGTYILEDEEGTGEEVGEFEDSLYLRAEYTYYDLYGNITGSTSMSIARQVGDYDETYYYGPVVWYANGIFAGFEEIISDMKDGGRRKIAMPGWLATYSRYDSAGEYFAAEGSAAAVYDIRLVDHFKDVYSWEIDSIGRYLAANYASHFSPDPEAAKADSSGAHGFYYLSTKEASEVLELKDTTVYINYIGRLLDGRVFDTNVRDTAVRYGLYTSGGSYSPVTITYHSAWSEIRMGDEDAKVVDGFARTLSKMGPGEAGTGIFYSKLGYDYSGSGSKIPAYSPLRFDIELVPNPYL